MPRDTIRRLTVDAERLLVAGAHLISTDRDFARDKAALDTLAAQLGAKAPAFGQLAATAAKAVAATGADAARELVAFATMTAQVRAAQAQPAPAPGLQPLGPRPAIGTPCNAKALSELYFALVATGKGRLERVQQAIERGDIADLRLVEPLIHAMGDGYIGDLIADKAVPLLGIAIVAPIRSQIRFADGRRIDARRLRAVVAADPATSRDLLVRALAEGCAEMREAALNAIADHLRGAPEFEQTILTMVASERGSDVFRAALRAMSGYDSDATLEALTTALEDARTATAAAEGLSHSRHPKAIDWMLDRLDQAVQAAAGERKARTPQPATGNRVRPGDMVTVLLMALRSKCDPRIAAAAMPLIEDYPDIAALTALNSADPGQLATIADLLMREEHNLLVAAVAAAAKLGPEQAFARLSQAFTAKDRSKQTGKNRLELVSMAIQDAPDPRWSALALKHLDGAMAEFAIPLLGRCKERKALDPLLAILEKKKSKLLAVAIAALGRIGDPVAIPAILWHCGHDDWQVRHEVGNALIAMDDPTVVERVRSLFAAQNDPDGADGWNLRRLLNILESHFPGK